MEKTIAIDKGVEPEVLTPTELRLVKLITEGWDNEDLAIKMGMSSRTVKHHRTNIYKKIFERYPNANAALLTRWACVNGLVEGMPW